MVKQCDVLILGAGPAGLTVGDRLTQEDISVCLIEKETEVGGLAKTLSYNNILLDIGPHILCSKEYVHDYFPDAYEYVRSLIQDDQISFEKTGQKFLEFVNVQGVHYKYPVNIMNAAKNVGIINLFKIGWDYLYSKKKYQKGGSDYESSLFSSLGPRLSNLFLMKLGEKTWGIPPRMMSENVIIRVGDFSIFDVFAKQIQNVFGSFMGKGSPVFYPTHGIGDISIAQEKRIISSECGSFEFKSQPHKISVENGRVMSVKIREESGLISEYYPKILVSSIPLSDLVNVIDPLPPEEIRRAAFNLKYRFHVCIYLCFNEDNILHEHCMYFADEEVPFVRIMEQKKFSISMLPVGVSVLCVEYLCGEFDGAWILKDEEIFEITVEWLKKLGIIENQAVVDYFTHREEHAYPLYDLEYENNLSVVRDYLNAIQNLKIIGRTGAFMYHGQYRVMRAGIQLANDIITDLS